MKKTKYSVLLIILTYVFILIACGSNINYKPTGGENDPFIIGGKDNEVEVNNYQYITKIQKEDSNRLRNTEIYIDSMIRGIRSLEEKFSVLNEAQLGNAERSLINKQIRINLVKLDSARSRESELRRRIRLRNLTILEYINSNSRQDSVGPEAIHIDDPIGHTKEQDVVKKEDDMTLNVSPQIIKGGILYSEYLKELSVPTSRLYTQIKQYEANIENFESQLIPIRNEINTLRNSMYNYQRQGGNQYQILQIKNKIAALTPGMKFLEKKKWRTTVNKDFNEFVLTRDSEGWVNQTKMDQVVHPKNGKELLENLKSNTKIVLSETEYDISPSKVGYISNPNVLEQGDYFIISDLINVEISGENKSKPHIFSNMNNFPVFNFENVKGMNLTNLLIGHSGVLNSKGECGEEGDVIQMSDSYNILIDDVQMYGCGWQGLDLYSSGDIKVTNSNIYECTDGAVSMSDCFNIEFEGCAITNNAFKYNSLIDISGSKNIYFNEISISGNIIDQKQNIEYSDLSIFSLDYGAMMFVENSSIKENLSDYYIDGSDGVMSANLSGIDSNRFRKGKYKE